MNSLHKLLAFFENNGVSLIITVLLILLYFIGKIIIYRLVKNQGQRNHIDYGRQLYIQKLSHFIFTLLILISLGVVWEISFKGLSIYFASAFTVIGVGLFATWSILSNLTASIILFFFYPYRIGQTIKIMDGDNSLEGKILDINLFYIQIKSQEGHTIAYPNNLAIQKAIRVP